MLGVERGVIETARLYSVFELEDTCVRERKRERERERDQGLREVGGRVREREREDGRNK